jgi:hypothetical protein
MVDRYVLIRPRINPTLVVLEVLVLVVEEDTMLEQVILSKAIRAKDIVCDQHYESRMS